jgi:hypothetical protein
MSLTAAATFNLPSIVSLKGQTFYFQALYATTTFPLAVSNVAPITFQ